MIKITLEVASNGVIKSIKDDNLNGAGEEMNLTSVHEFSDGQLEKAVLFLYELAEDLGISTGNKYEKEVINITTRWGHKYEPSIEEISKKIETLEEELAFWKSALDEHEV